MATDDRITLYYSPQTRAGGSRFILEELGAPHDLHILNMKAGEHRRPEFLAVNPLGKVPTIRHRGQIITEQVAIAIYLGDLFPEAGLTPAIDDPLRGPYLRWMAYYGASFEPAVIDRWRKLDPGDVSRSVYGDFATMIGTVEAQFANGPYLLGERRTVVDLLWGIALAWTTTFGLVERTPLIDAYVQRVTDRDSHRRIQAEDAVLAEEHAKLAQG